MKIKEFNQLKKDVKAGNLEGLEDVISDLTLNQAQSIEDLMYDLKLTDEMNKVLDEIVNHINNLVKIEKVANKKAPKKEEKKEPKKEEKKEEKKEKKEEKKEEGNNILERVQVGDIVKFRVEGEEIEHPVKIIYISRYDIIAITKNEREVFKIRKVDFSKQIFEWTDRHGETYNIIVTL